MKILFPTTWRAHLLTFGFALTAIALPNGADAQESVDAALARQVEGAKVSLARGLLAAKTRGTPISAKYEVEGGKLQLSVYTAKAGHFDEVVVDNRTGKIAKADMRNAKPVASIVLVSDTTSKAVTEPLD